jgi:iron complex transport system permease protein
MTFVRILCAAGLLGAALGAGLCLGSEPLSPGDLVAALGGDDVFARLLRDWRLPRVLAAGLIGALLGVSGTMFQGVFRNPLAEPFLLGSAPGAALGATVAILLPLPLPPLVALPAFAFCGAFGATLLVLGLARALGVREIAGLLLAGVAVSAFLAATRSFLMLSLSDETIGLQVVLSWTMGGVQTPFWSELAGFAALAAVGLALAFGCAHGLDLLGLGEDAAVNMGLDLRRFTLGVLTLASALVALAVTWGGTIGFIGLIVPYLARLWGGARHSISMPLAAMIGAATMMLLDGVARAALPPAEIPVGLLTALLGAPFFLVILAKWSRR